MDTFFKPWEPLTFGPLGICSSCRTSSEWHSLRWWALANTKGVCCPRAGPLGCGWSAAWENGWFRFGETEFDRNPFEEGLMAIVNHQIWGTRGSLFPDPNELWERMWELACNLWKTTMREWPNNSRSPKTHLPMNGLLKSSQLFSRVANTMASYRTLTPILGVSFPLLLNNKNSWSMFNMILVIISISLWYNMMCITTIKWYNIT